MTGHVSLLADALQAQAQVGGLSEKVLRLNAAPARRVAEALERAYTAKAAQTNQTLSIEVDAAGNSLIIAAPAPLFEEIRKTVEELDALAPAAGQGIFIIELEHVDPDESKRVIEAIGLHREPRDDSVSRLVSEPITITPLEGRNAVMVVANPADRDTVVELLKSIDAEPEFGTPSSGSGNAESRLK